jgi:hypothetical protein
VISENAGPGDKAVSDHEYPWPTARRYRTIQIQAGPHVITAADPLPDDLRQALEAINSTS